MIRKVISATFILAIAACSRVEPIPEAEKAEIDCLASIAVVEITDYIRAGDAAGTDPSELMHIVPDKIAEAKEKLKAKYGGEIDAAYLEYDINHRLIEIEDALKSGDPNSIDHLNMTETVQLGRSCTFGT